MTRSASLVFGGASGLGWSTAQSLAARGDRVVIADLPAQEARVTATLPAGATFVAADVTDEAEVSAAVATAAGLGDLRRVVSTAGGGGPARVVARDLTPGPLQSFERVLRLNAVGTYNVLRLGAAAMASNEPADGERGVVVLTASTAAFDGQVGQVAYAAAKAAIVGMTLPAARDLAAHGIRVCSIAPGIFDTPLLGRIDEGARRQLAESVPFPCRLGDPSEFAELVVHILDNRYLNGEVIRVDGALRMAPR